VRVLKVFFVGEGITSAKRYLEECADRYDKAVSNVVNVRVGVRIMTAVDTVLKSIASQISKTNTKGWRN
jgi:hypothetical protein